eukprot:354935-Chlamydomonas_euryale.AAC.3
MHVPVTQLHAAPPRQMPTEYEVSLLERDRISSLDLRRKKRVRKKPGGPGDDDVDGRDVEHDYEGNAGGTDAAAARGLTGDGGDGDGGDSGAMSSSGSDGSRSGGSSDDHGCEYDRAADGASSGDIRGTQQLARPSQHRHLPSAGHGSAAAAHAPADSCGVSPVNKRARMSAPDATGGQQPDEVGAALGAAHTQ